MLKKNISIKLSINIIFYDLYYTKLYLIKHLKLTSFRMHRRKITHVHSLLSKKQWKPKYFEKKNVTTR